MSALALLLLVACSSSPPPTKPVDKADKAQTGPADSCQTNADCYCRRFNGARFEPGRANSRCCLEADGCTENNRTVPVNHCAACIYE